MSEASDQAAFSAVKKSGWLTESAEINARIFRCVDIALDAYKAAELMTMIEIQTIEGGNREWVAICGDSNERLAIEWGSSFLAGMGTDKPGLRATRGLHGPVTGIWTAAGYEPGQGPVKADEDLAKVVLGRIRNVLTDSSLRPDEKTAICRGIIFDYEAQRKELL